MIVKINKVQNKSVRLLVHASSTYKSIAEWINKYKVCSLIAGNTIVEQKCEN